MKDYKLSEIKAICQKYYPICVRCPFNTREYVYSCYFEKFQSIAPHTWQIDEEESEYYTLAEMQSMSPHDIEQHWDKVQRSLRQIKEETDDD